MNDETEKFESRLIRQPLRQIPGEWRAEILEVCQRSIVEGRAQELVSPSTLGSRLAAIFWPHPKAWVGLAAIWVLILAVNFSMHDKTSVVTKRAVPPPPEVVAELRQQRLLFAELIGLTEIQVADRQRSFLPRPRSEREEILMS